MRSRFEPDVVAGVSTRPSSTLIDPEAYDASEQQFSASLEQGPQPRFVVEGETETDATTITGRKGDASIQYSVESQNGVPSAELDTQDLITTAQADKSAEPAKKSTAPPAQGGLQEEGNPERWRQEVAARLNNYRARRRPRAPRYPSLRLKFEEDQEVGVTPSSLVEPPVAVQSAHRTRPAFKSAVGAETPAKIIEFPRSSAAPSRFDELAEPMLDHPRILEAPEVVPTPPALGGILIEPAEQPPCEKRPGFEMPLQSASMSRRLAAVAIDGVLVACAVAVFVYIFLRLTRQVPALQPAVGTALVLIGLFWVAYQYLLLVYSGISPGLKLAGLQLRRFDGTTAPRRLRRWRVLASVLSGVSLGLGYAWCFLDEDRLCWHDRITHTYMAPKE
jgi:hypothetical protein